MQLREPVQRDLLQVHGVGCQKSKNNFKVGKKKLGVLDGKTFGNSKVGLLKSSGKIKVRETRIF